MRTYAMLFLLGLFILFITASTGCKQNQEPSQENTSTEETQAKAPNVEITAGERSPAFPDAKTRFNNINNGDVLEDANVSVIVDVWNYELGIQTETPRAEQIANSGEGQHAHIILDNDPYFADYEPGVPFDLGKLDEGAHTLVVFPSRSYHESVKSEGSADIVNFYVGKQEGEFLLDETKPTIIYSRPKGKYEGHDAQKIMLDFYLINAELGEDKYKAKYTIRKNEADAEEYTITMTEWTPAFVTGLSSGEYIITLELLDSEGNLVDGAYNNTQRSITVVTN